jgi:TonB family protein
MMSASVAGRLSHRSRADAPGSRRLRGPLYRPPATHGGLPTAVAVSIIGHVAFFAALAGMLMWTTLNRPKLYVVNLVPAVAAVGVATAPPAPSSPVRAPAPAPPARNPAPEPPPAPKAPAPREVARLPEPTWSPPRLPALPARPTLPRPGEKELPPMASPRVTSAPTTTTARPDKTDRPADPRPAPSATLGQPTGSPSGVGALSLTTEPDQKPHILVEIQRDGSIRMPEIQQTSGNTVYDQAALRAVFDASPFPPLPQDWSKPSLRVMFRFDLTPVRG